MTSKRKKIIACGVLAVLMAIGGGVFFHHANSPATASPEKSDLTQTVLAVMPLSRGLNDGVLVTGSVMSLDDVEISSKIGGRLANVYVREGDPVQAGQVLAQLDSSDLAAQKRSAQAAADGAKSKIDQAKALLYQQKVTVDSSIRSAKAALNQQTVSVEADVANSEATLKSAKANLSQVREGAEKQELAESNSAVAIAQANYDKAASDLKRYKMLRDEEAVAPVTYDQFANAANVAKAELDAAKQRDSLLKEGARSQEIVQAEQAVRQAEDRLRNAQAARAQIESRNADLASAVASKSQIKVRQADIEAAQSEYKQAMASLSIANQALADGEIRSPISGVVSWRGADRGQVVAAGATMIKVVSLSAIRFDAAAPETQLGKIAVGDSVSVSVSAFPNRKYEGHVIRIFPSASPINRTFGVRIAVEDSSKTLRPQMFASGKILAPKKRAQTLVPTDALLDAIDAPSHKNRLFYIENGVAKECPVQIGAISEDGQWAEAIGAPLDYPVVALGQKTLQAGEKVTAKIISRQAPQQK